MTEPTSCDRDHVVHKVSVFTVYAVVEQFVEPSLTQSKGKTIHSIKKPTTYTTYGLDPSKLLWELSPSVMIFTNRIQAQRNSMLSPHSGFSEKVPSKVT